MRCLPRSSWPDLTRPSSQLAISLDSRAKRGYDNRVFQSTITAKARDDAIEHRNIALRPLQELLAPAR